MLFCGFSILIGSNVMGTLSCDISTVDVDVALPVVRGICPKEFRLFIVRLITVLLSAIAHI